MLEAEAGPSDESYVQAFCLLEFLDPESSDAAPSLRRGLDEPETLKFHKSIFMRFRILDQVRDVDIQVVACG